MSRSRKQRKPRRRSHTKVEGLPRWARSNEAIKLQLVDQPAARDAVASATTPYLKRVVKGACKFYGSHHKIALPFGMTKRNPTNQ